MSLQHNAAAKCPENNEKRIVALNLSTHERDLMAPLADAARNQTPT